MDVADRLLEKSIESFLLGLEIYNKPTIKYRIEGFAFFICNAWELMIKAHICNKEGEEAIYHKDNKNRTISLSEAIRKVFTNNKDPLRRNLEKIVELRNTSTHFVTQEYEYVYIPLFQACLRNFETKIFDFHGRSLNDVLPLNFLTLHARVDPINEEDIRGRYSEGIVNHLLKIKQEIDVATEQGGNSKFSIPIEYNLVLTKRKQDADIVVAIDNTAEASGMIIKDIREPSNLYPLSFGQLLNEIQKGLEKGSIEFSHTNKSGKQTTKFNKYSLGLIFEFFGIKADSKYAYLHKLGANAQYTYSRQLVDFILDTIRKESTITNTILTSLQEENG